MDNKLALKNHTKVCILISVFEESTKMNENASNEIVIERHKNKIENAFMKMMNSSGRNTPSPRKRLKKKRLKSVKSQEGNIEAWIQKEKR